jgi:uncharacterized protein YhfF
MGGTVSNVPDKYRDLPRWSFGDSAQLADELLALVLKGHKTATCGALWQYERDGVAVPQAGELSIVLDGDHHPRCVIETVDVQIKRFDQVDAQFASDEGEGDRSYAYWRDAHETYFRRQGQFSTDMLVVCERFRVIEKLPGGLSR